MSKPRHSKLTKSRKKVIEALYDFCYKHRLTIEDAKVYFIDGHEELVVTVGVTGMCVVYPPLVKAESVNPQYTWVKNNTWERKGRTWEQRK